MIPAGGAAHDANIAFVPLAMPLMCGPGGHAAHASEFPLLG
jgi:multiple antibiotic resistance protein